MNKESEKAYIFGNDVDISYISSRFNNLQWCEKLRIIDYYINENFRVRYSPNGILTTYKCGNKNTERVEIEKYIDKDLAEILIKNSKLKIEKTRYYAAPNHNSNSVISLDIVNSPLKIKILEIEKINNNLPYDNFITENNLTKCPLSAWNFFKRKIGICGGPSAGKTTLSRDLSKKINIDLGGNSFPCLEYCTTFIQKYNKIPQLNDQFMIWYQQSQREKDTQNKSDIVISDSPSFLSYIYAIYNSKNKSLDKDKIIYLSKIYKRVLDHLGSYSDIIFLETLDYKEDNIRYQNKEEAKEISNTIQSFLENHGVKFIKSNYNQINDILRQIFYLNSLQDLG